MPTLEDYLKQNTGYTPPAGSLAELLANQKTKTPAKTVIGQYGGTAASPIKMNVYSDGSQSPAGSGDYVVPAAAPVAPVQPGGVPSANLTPEQIQAGYSNIPGPYNPVTGELNIPAGAGVGAGVGEVPATQDYSAMWQTEYDKSGMEDIKTQISGVDTDITNRKAARDQSLLDEKGKPIPQWMITGRKALEIEAATGDLNRLIDKRNTLAEQYNTGIGEVERKVSYAISYSQEMQRQLESTRGYGLEEKLYELRKTEAEKPEAPKTSSITYESGGRQYLRTYNSVTGETIKIEDLGPIQPKDVAAGKYNAQAYVDAIMAGQFWTTDMDKNNKVIDVIDWTKIPAEIRDEVYEGLVAAQAAGTEKPGTPATPAAQGGTWWEKLLGIKPWF